MFAYIIEIPAARRAALAALVGHVRQLVGDGSGGMAMGVARLFPPASSDDQVAETFRELTLTEAHLQVTARLDLLVTACTQAEGFVVSHKDVTQVMTAIGYVRLVVAQWLGIERGYSWDQEVSPQLLREWQVSYDLLSYLQDYFATELLRTLP